MSARHVHKVLQYYKEQEDIIAILVMDELSEDDNITVSRARKIQKFLSQPFFVAETFTGSPGKYVEVKDTVQGVKEIIDGKCDDIPEQAFYMMGGMDEVRARHAKMQKENAEARAPVRHNTPGRPGPRRGRRGHRAR